MLVVMWLAGTSMDYGVNSSTKVGELLYNIWSKVDQYIRIYNLFIEIWIQILYNYLKVCSERIIIIFYNYVIK